VGGRSGIEVAGRGERRPAVVERDHAAEGGDRLRVGEPAAPEDAQRVLADTYRPQPGVRPAEQRRDGPRMLHEQPAVGAGEAPEVLDPVAGRRIWLEAAEHAVEQRVDELLLRREVVVERHRHRPETRGDRAHAQRVEALSGRGLGRVEDHLGRQGPAAAAGAGTRSGIG
jgi:hypothetical protein